MILQDHIPYDIAARPGLPGVAPLAMTDWLQVDEAYAPQMTERRRLLATIPAQVHAVQEDADAPAIELRDMVMEIVGTRSDFTVRGTQVTGPDGVTTDVAAAQPLMAMGSVLQEDFCILTKPIDAEEHVLSGAVLCFPASWRLSEKIGRPLGAVHQPVAEYPAIAQHVQRLFDGVQPNRPLWRFNVLAYEDAALFQPRSETVPRPLDDPGQAPFIRSERQCLVRLPRTRAVVFSIHTYVIARPRA